MVRRLVPVLIATAIVALGAIAGCTLLVDGAPENTCRGDGDCFRAQGEVCDLETKRCIVGDAGVQSAAADARADLVDAGD